MHRFWYEMTVTSRRYSQVTYPSNCYVYSIQLACATHVLCSLCRFTSHWCTRVWMISAVNTSTCSHLDIIGYVLYTYISIICRCMFVYVHHTFISLHMSWKTWHCFNKLFCLTAVTHTKIETCSFENDTKTTLSSL